MTGTRLVATTVWLSSHWMSPMTCFSVSRMPSSRVSGMISLIRLPSASCFLKPVSFSEALLNTVMRPCVSMATIPSWTNRITSYNVCYTKLLRANSKKVLIH